MISDDKKFITDNTLSRISNIAMSYVCRLKPKPGFLDLDKCVKHNVPPGPLLGLLKSGKDITLSDGTLVKSSDVTSPDDPGPVFIGKVFQYDIKKSITNNFIINIFFLIVVPFISCK